MEYLYLVLGFIGLGIGCALFWMVSCLIILGIMRFNVWAASVERRMMNGRRRAY